MAVNWLLYDNPFPGRAAVAPIYAGSRVEVAGRPGYGDGSNGDWAAEWVREWGVALLRDLELPDDSTVEDERLAVRWTQSRTGVPENFEKLAKVRPIKATPAITTVDELAVSIQAGAPVFHGSNLIPTGKVNSNYVSRVRRSGGHLTAFTAVRWLDGDPYFLYQNSWNGWGTQGWPDDQPAGSVWIPPADAQSILNQRDAFAAAGVGGMNPMSRCIAHD